MTDRYEKTTTIALARESHPTRDRVQLSAFWRVV